MKTNVSVDKLVIDQIRRHLSTEIIGRHVRHRVLTGEIRPAGGADTA